MDIEKEDKVSDVSRVNKVSGQGRPACTTTQETVKRNAFLNNGRPACTNTLETAKEVRSMVKNTHAPCGRGKGEGLLNDKTCHKATEPASCKSLVPQCLIPLVPFRRAAFTLAEVLITLAIIGIVAALTIPNLIQSYKKRVVETRLAKFYSTFNQAINLSQVDNESYMLWNFPGGNASAEEVREWHDKYFLPYIKVIKSEMVQVGNWYRVVDYLIDGSAVIISSYTTWLYFPDAKDMKMEARTEENEDDNTAAGTFYPDNNTSGIKWFTFQFTPLSSSKQYHNKNLQPYLTNWDGTIDDLKNDSSLGCYRTGNVSRERAYCAQLIMLNGWKIPDDYPFKF